MSAITPTRNRPAFLARAVQSFLAQDYPDAELIIIDDDDAPSGSHPSITYLSLPRRLRIGAKRNIACELAQGDLILHWDDDDLHAPNRISAQVAALGDADLSGMPEMLYREGDALWLYRGPAGWLAGNSLLYRKTLWRTRPFAPISIGEDVDFVDAHMDGRIAPCTDLSLTVAVTHPGNTSPRDHGGDWTLFPGS